VIIVGFVLSDPTEKDSIVRGHNDKKSSILRCSDVYLRIQEVESNAFSTQNQFSLRSHARNISQILFFQSPPDPSKSERENRIIR
jgi:hypothetical protein